MIIGALGTRQRAQVRGGGTVVVHEGTPDELELTWWVGADDRWHALETAVTARQSLVRDLPVVSTTARIPSGDAVANSFVAVQGPRELVVLDLDNRSKVPFAAALVLRGRAAHDITLDGAVVRVSGLPLLHLPRAPQRSAAAAHVDALFDIVTTGRAAERFEPIDGPAAVAFVFPVTHGTSLRAALLLGASNPLAFTAAPVLAALPTIHDVASGWDLQLARGAQLRPSLADVGTPYRTALAAALLAAEPTVVSGSSTLDRALLAAALDTCGFAAEAGALLEDVPDRQGRRGAFDDDPMTTAVVVDAVSRHAALTHDAVFAETMAVVAAGALERLMKLAKKDPSLQPLLGCSALLPAMFRVARDPRAAAKAASLAPSDGAPLLPPAPPLPASSAGASFAPEDAVRLHEALRRHVDAAVRCTERGVEVLRGMTRTAFGQPVEVRNVPTPWGRLSFAVRWHGERPALLWECTPVHDDQRADELVLHAPVFGDWTGRGASGEALLPAPPLPGA